MENKHQHTSIVGPSLLIGIGILLLLDNLGYLQWDFWQLTRLWPVMLIVWGLDILLQGRLVGKIITAVVVLAFVLGGAWLLTKGEDVRSKTEIEYLRNDSTSLVVDFKPSIGKLSLDAYNDSANLIGGSVMLPKGIFIDEDYTSGNRARLQITTKNSTRSWWPGQHESWDFNLNRDALLDMDLDLAIGEMDLNLSKLNVNRMNAHYGIGTATVELPASGIFDISIDGGIGTIVLYVPYDTAVRITTDTGIVSKSFLGFGDYTRSGDDWISPQLSQSENRANISLSLGIGTIVVKRVP